MTPVLCLNCGKVHGEHLISEVPTWCHDNLSDPRIAEMKWRSPEDESAIEQHTVEAIATWLTRENTLNGSLWADLIRSGACK
jgi:hypothetical protein